MLNEGNGAASDPLEVLVTVVCGTDFSPQAQEASGVAARLAAALGEPLMLVHVADELGSEATLGGSHDSLYDPRRRDLAAEATRLEALGPPVTPTLVAGVAADRLGEVAASRGASLVVLGAGTRRPGQIRLGSTAARLVRSCHAPMLLLRTFTPFHAWLDGGSPLRVAVGDDLHETGAAALAWVAVLRRAGPLAVTHVHVAAGDRPAAEAERALKERARSVAPDVEVRVVPRGGASADHALADAAHAVRADLVVVGSSQRSWLARWRHPSVAGAVVDQASVSVAVAVASAAPAHEVRRLRAVLAVSGGAREEVLAFARGATFGSVHTIEVPDAAAPGDVAGAAAAVVELADRLDVDAVCVASGPLAEELLRDLRRPLLVVPR